MKIILIVVTKCQILTAKMHQTRFWLGHCPRPRGELTALPWPPSWWEGTGCPSPQSSQCRETVKYVLIRLHCTSKMHILRSFIGGVRATGTLCPYSALRAARPLAGLKGPKVEGPPSRGRVGPPDF